MEEKLVKNNKSSKQLLLSIIVPVYNVEHYIDKCLKSIIDQSLSKNEFEVIIVDDKSTDNSIDICRSYCKQYTNFCLIELKKNTPGGAGIPSNIGIKYARGKYIGFVDSDDYIEPNMFKNMLIKAQNMQADITICNFYIYSEKDNKIFTSYDQSEWQKFYRVYSEQYSLYTLKQKALALSPVPWRKIYNKEFLEKFHIRYPEGDFFYEDNPLHWFTIIQARSIAVVNESLIVHRLGRKGQTMDIQAKKLLAFTIHGKIILEFLKSIDKYEKYKIEYLNWVFQQSSWILPKLGKYKKLYLQDIKKLCIDINIYDVQKLINVYKYNVLTKYYIISLIKNYYFLLIIISKMIKFKQLFMKLYKRINNSREC